MLSLKMYYAAATIKRQANEKNVYIYETRNKRSKVYFLYLIVFLYYTSEKQVTCFNALLRGDKRQAGPFTSPSEKRRNG